MFANINAKSYAKVFHYQKNNSAVQDLPRGVACLLLRLVHGNKCEKGAVRVTDFAIYQQTNGLRVCPTTLKMLQKNVLFADRDSIIC